MFKVPKSFYNWLSITGFILAINSLVLILVLLIISLTSESGGVYLGVYTYVVLPAFLVLGLILIPLGMLIRWRRSKRWPEEVKRWPVMDLNEKSHRAILIRVSVITFIFLIASAMGSYQAFQYTESVEFCGKLCHSVMEPEYTTYLHSPHARVACVECHVGEGADWYVRSKLSGLYQVYAATFNKYPRPIPTPITSLRPARETCERCHWPQKFYARKLRSELRYVSDSANTEWNYALLMKIGPTHSAQGLKEGIHWHINPDIQIEYASVPNREVIPWVKYTNLKTGEVRIYQDEETEIDEDSLRKLEQRTMDCMDCHNRPSHLYLTPPMYFNHAMAAGNIPKDLPYIKMIAMEVLKYPFEDKEKGIRFIRDSITAFYQSEWPDVYAARGADIHNAIDAIVREYSLNAFPSMKVDASVYLNHIGHLESDGCFRCHNDRHSTSDGKVISKDCNLCHTIISQGAGDAVTSVDIGRSLEFIHPVTLRNDIWKTAMCSECHRTPYE